MPEAWPGTLPQEPLYEGYREAVPNGILRTQMDAGPPKQRRRYTAAPRRFTMTLCLTKAQVAVLDSFVLNNLNGGVDAFTWTHPRTGAGATYRFAGETPVYQAFADDLWVTSLSVEILP